MADRKLVLVVDDEALVLSLIERIVRTRYRVRTALGGRAALEALAAPETIDASILLCDSRMPDVAGAEVMREAARLRPDTVALMLTAYPDIDAVVAAVNQGRLFRFLFKPVEREALLSALDEASREHERQLACRRLLAADGDGQSLDLARWLCAAAQLGPPSPGTAGPGPRLAAAIAGWQSCTEDERQYWLDCAAALRGERDASR